MNINNLYKTRRKKIMLSVICIALGVLILFILNHKKFNQTNNKDISNAKEVFQIQ